METQLKDRQTPTKAESLKVAEIETSAVPCSDPERPSAIACMNIYKRIKPLKLFPELLVVLNDSKGIPKKFPKISHQLSLNKNSHSFRFSGCSFNP